MNKNNIKKKIAILRDVKRDIDIVIRDNKKNLNMDELEWFEFVHKLDKMDVILNSMEKDLNLDDEDKSSKSSSSLEKSNDVICNENNIDDGNFNLQRTTIIEDEYLDQDGYSNVSNNYIDQNESSNVGNNYMDQDDYSNVDNNEEVKIENFESSLNDTNKKIEYLEKLLEEKRFIEEKDLELYMKEIHLKEEREAMLRKRQIVAQSFTPKSKEQSDSTIDKTIAMSKEEFYDKIDGSKTEILDIPIEIQEERPAQNIDESDYCFSEDYDLYEEEKNNSIIDKFKDLLGK
ncbi:MAG: hypothetical protein ACRCYC_06240 [Paraclostridium sp.]|uniref:hypothetical protein n=1 Tax=Paraclostridium sp. TaxID=2023273 RepID=UPI003F31BD69